MVEQIKHLKVEIRHEEIEEIKKNGEFEVKTNNSIYKAKKIILATGSKKRKLGIKGEEEFSGKGVSYCATCDAAFFKDDIVAVVGGSDAALTAAILLSEYAKKVYIVYRRENFFRAEPTWIKQVEENKKIEPVFNSNIKEIKGSNKVESIVLDSGKELSVDGVFIAAGDITNNPLKQAITAAAQGATAAASAYGEIKGGE
ncbi:MAG: hypothetical protein B6U68_04385 [Candidatus Aenigmarchaeota archaeon ex4484_14]|nr:MAG: hypothetical protein B6U68_04385 [Candidatus Aenigmarchaeota archaeon ex4484_14]